MPKGIYQHHNKGKVPYKMTDEIREKMREVRLQMYKDGWQHPRGALGKRHPSYPNQIAATILWHKERKKEKR